MAIDPGDLTDDTTPPPTGQQQQQQLTPEALHQELQRTRSEAAKYRTQNRDLRRLLSTVSGEEVPEGRPAPDVATLQQRFASLNSGDKATIRTLKIQKQLIATSHKRGIEDPDYLEYQLSRSGQLADLDPDAEDFGEALDERVAEFLVSRPEVRGRQSGPPPPPQGTGAQFRPSQPRLQLTRESLAAMSPSEVVAAKEAGLLDRLLGRG